MWFKSPVKSWSVQHNATFAGVGHLNTIKTSVPKSTWSLNFCKGPSDCINKDVSPTNYFGITAGHRIFGTSRLADGTELGRSHCAQSSGERGGSKLEGGWSCWAGNTGQLASGCLTLVGRWKQGCFLGCCMEKGPVPLRVSWKQNRMGEGAGKSSSSCRCRAVEITTSLRCSQTQACALSHGCERELILNGRLKEFWLNNVSYAA